MLFGQLCFKQSKISYPNKFDNSVDPPHRSANQADTIQLVICASLSLVEEISHTTANSRYRCSKNQRLEACFPRVKANHSRFGVAQAEQLYSSNGQDGCQLLAVGADYSVGYNVGQGGEDSEEHEGDESDYSALQGQFLVYDYQAQLFKHHDVDKGLTVGGNEVGYPVALLDVESLFQVNVNDFLLLVVNQVLDFVEFSGFLRLDVLDFSSGREVVSQSHAYAVANHCSQAERHDAFGGFKSDYASQDDDEGVDASVQPAIDQGLEDVPRVHMRLLMFLLHQVLLEACACARTLH